LARAFRPLRPAGTVISSGPGRKPDTLHSTAADRCDTTAPGPLTKQAAIARCFQVTGTPASRYTPEATRTHRPVLIR
jgi:hypothetical protein